MAELAEKTEAVASGEAAAGTPAVKTVELTKKFGRTVALAGLSMTVPRGEVFGFLGPNGAGKTTAVKLLLGEPELVFLDEPTSALDPVGRHDVREIIRGLASRGTAVFLNSHLLSEVEQVCDRVAVVDHGRVIAEGTMDALLGGGTAVRVRVTGLAQADKNKLASFGRIDDEGEQLTFASLDPERVPELVTEIVAMGGRVYEVAPRHQTL